jgi:soluble lytic murein transglycosylase-like protein
MPRVALRRRAVLAALLGCICLAGAAGASERADPALKALLQQAVDSSDSFVDRFEAEVWLSDMDQRLARHRPKIPAADRIELLKQVHREATRAAISPELVLAVIDIESRFDRYAISSVGAQGLMQVMPFWLREIGHPEDNLFELRTNLRMGCTILKYYLDRTNGDVRKALNRYNGTRRRKYSDNVLTVLSTRWYKS